MRIRARARSNEISPGFVRWAARIALLTLVVQLSSLGHWSFGPFHAEPGALAAHAAHCHGDTSGCGGQPSFAGTYVERPLAVTIPAATISLSTDSHGAPAGVVAPLPDLPPKAA